MNVQGNVLHAYGVRFPCATYLLLRVTGEARPVLDRWRRHVTFHREPPAFHGAHLNLAFTYEGLRALGAPLGDLPEDFRAGPARRDLGDRAESAPEQWEFGNPPAHVLAIIHASDEDTRERAVRALDDDAFTVAHRQDAALLERPTAFGDHTCSADYAREHFGFADGCSQPAVAGIDDDAVGDGVYEAQLPPLPRELLETVGVLKPKRKWRGVRLGEFVLGYENEDWDRPAGSDSPVGPDGTFMVYRKMEQHVDVFRKHTERCAQRFGMQPDHVRAKIVGRWQDGTPLALSPDRSNPDIATDRARANHFHYDDDPAGEKTPIGSHIRRTNPRDGLPPGGEAVMRHRMIRRGMPYDRGLVFACFGASLERGFETVQRRWCATGHALGLGDEPDYLLQQRPGPGEPPTGRLQIAPKQVLPPPPEPFVTVRGTEYLLLPGREGLARIAEAAR